MDPTAFSTQANRKNNGCPEKQGQGRQGFKEGRKEIYFHYNKFDHYARECPNKKDTPRDMITTTTTTTTTTISRAMEIKEIIGSTTMEREMLQLHDMEMDDLLGSQETLGMRKLMS